jgi:Mrp family chromosome partitioning ATPase
MCNPIAFGVATMIISMAGTFMSQKMQNDRMDQQQEHVEEAVEKEIEYIEEAEEIQLETLDAEIEEIDDKYELEKLDRQRQALRERAKIRTAASESGAFGNSTLRSLAVSFANQGHDTGVIDYNQRSAQDQLEREKGATKINAKRQKNNAKASIPLGSGSNPFFSGMSILTSGVSGGMSGYATGKSIF